MGVLNKMRKYYVILWLSIIKFNIPFLYQAINMYIKYKYRLYH